MTSLLAEYSRLKRDRRKEREADNNRTLVRTKYDGNGVFEMTYDADGKFLRIIGDEPVTHCMFFMASNRWRWDEQDYYGTLSDFKAWYNKRVGFERFTR